MQYLNKVSKMQSRGFDMMRRWRSKIWIAVLQLLLRSPLSLVALVYTTIAVRMAFVSDQMLFAFPMGLILFSLVEYAIHRWIFHYFEISNPGLYDRLHGAHHRKPNDMKRQSVPLFYSFIVAVPVIALSLFGAFEAAIATGFTVGYIIFEVLHAVAHARWAKRSKVPLVRILVQHHVTHHYKDSKTAYGLSIPLWDLVFRSAGTAKKATSNSGNDFVRV